jgi:hypothetical protein
MYPEFSVFSRPLCTFVFFCKNGTCNLNLMSYVLGRLVLSAVMLGVLPGRWARPVAVLPCFSQTCLIYMIYERRQFILFIIQHGLKQKPFPIDASQESPTSSRLRGAGAHAVTHGHGTHPRGGQACSSPTHQRPPHTH